MVGGQQYNVSHKIDRIPINPQRVVAMERLHGLGSTKQGAKHHRRHSQQQRAHSEHIEDFASEATHRQWSYSVTSQSIA